MVGCGRVPSGDLLVITYIFLTGSHNGFVVLFNILCTSPLHQPYLYFSKHLNTLVSTITNHLLCNLQKDKVFFLRRLCLYLEVEPLGAPQKEPK